MADVNRSLAFVVPATVMGLLIGVGTFTFVYAKGYSYLTNDPSACANCHIMREHYEAWTKASHRAVAVCNDCHTPPGLIPTYVTKARNGFWHSFYFTTELFHEPIQITASNRDVLKSRPFGKRHSDPLRASPASRSSAARLNVHNRLSETSFTIGAR